AAGISVRHLHRLFAAKSCTVAEWIRGRRLERCRTDLSDPHLRDRNITDIALGWGFSDSAHFSHSFKQEFGVSPREFRSHASSGKPIQIPPTPHAQPGANSQFKGGRPRSPGHLTRTPARTDYFLAETLSAVGSSSLFCRSRSPGTLIIRPSTAQMASAIHSCRVKCPGTIGTTFTRIMSEVTSHPNRAARRPLKCGFMQ